MTLSPEAKSEIDLTNVGATDCGVIAIQAVSGVGRKRAEQLAKEHGQYKPEVGTPRDGLNSCLYTLGYRLIKISAYKETVATFAMTHEYGVFLIYTDGHVMALVEGDLHNSRGSWHEWVEDAYRVERNQL